VRFEFTKSLTNWQSIFKCRGGHYTVQYRLEQNNSIQISFYGSYEKQSNGKIRAFKSMIGNFGFIKMDKNAISSETNMILRALVKTNQKY